MRLAAVRLVALLPAAAAQTLDRAQMDQFVRDLRAEMARDDRAAVVARVRYPLVVFAAGTRIPIADAAALRQNFNLVFPPALKAIIASTAPALAADVATIAANVQIRRDGDRLRITRIDLPLGAAATSSRTSRGRRTARRSTCARRTAPGRGSAACQTMATTGSTSCGRQGPQSRSHTGSS